MVSDPVDPVPNEEIGDAALLRANLILRPVVEDADLVALRIHIQKLQAKNEDLFAPRTGNLKTQTDTLLKLCSEMKRVGVLKLEVMRLTQQLAEVRTAWENSGVGEQAMEDVVAAKDAAEIQVVALVEELSGLKTTNAPKIHARDAEVEPIKVLLIRVQKKVDDAEHKGNGAKSALAEIANWSRAIPGGGASGTKRDCRTEHGTLP